MFTQMPGVAGATGRRTMDTRDPIGELEREMDVLDAQRRELDLQIKNAQDRQRYSTDPAEVQRGKAEEETLLRELDRLMTRYRAMEGRLLLARKGEKRPWFA
jgi:predicted  nucleic acid-binding Zn-ribbon protein